MKIADLEKIVHANNQKHLSKLLGREVHIQQGKASISPTDLSELVDCFRGKTSKGFTSKLDLMHRCIQLSPTGKCVAVGSIIDDDLHSKEEDLPVIIAVGINYGQGSDYLLGNVGLLDSTKMRSKLLKVLESLRKECANFPESKSFHLVAANFFPWITDNSWGEYALNSIEEMALIKCIGHEDPCEHVAELISSLEETAPLTAVVFHGANNSVPFLGDALLRSVKSRAFNAIFCDNLAGSVGNNICNAISLCSHQSAQQRNGLPQCNYDE